MLYSSPSLWKLQKGGEKKTWKTYLSDSQVEDKTFRSWILLVGGWATPLNNMKVNWDDYSQHMGKQKKFQTTKQFVTRYHRYQRYLLSASASQVSQVHGMRCHSAARPIRDPPSGSRDSRWSPGPSHRKNHRPFTNCLVGQYTHPSEQYDFVNWDDDYSQYMHKKWQPNHQADKSTRTFWDHLWAIEKRDFYQC